MAQILCFVWAFPLKASLPSQLFIRSEQFRYNLGTNLFHVQMFPQNRVNGRLSQTNFFCFHSSSQSAVTEHERMHTIDVFITFWGGGASWLGIVLRVFTTFPKTLDLLDNSYFLQSTLSINLLRHLMDFGAIFAQFYKKRDGNSLLKLLMDRHIDNARIRVPRKSIARSLSYSGLAPIESQLRPLEWGDLERCSTS